MERRSRVTFLALVVVQVAHSSEEYVFGLYEVFAPARLASELVSNDPATGFALLNTAIFLFGAWCYLARVQPGRPSALGWMWLWIWVELGNGVVHSSMAFIRGGYFPGLVTAPLLLGLAAFLAVQLIRARRSSQPAPT